MKSKKIIAVVGGSFLLAAAFLLILCIKFVNMKESSPTGKYAGKTEKVEQTTTDKKEQKKPDWVEEKISGMTLEEKVAQLFIITPEALTGMGKVTAAGDTTKRCLEQYPVGGMIYFAGNIEDRQQLSDMLHTTQSYSTEQSGIPIFLSVDEEGGTVARVAGSGISNVSVVEDMCEVTDEERAYEIGQTIGNYLAELGFNLDYAPVGDVLTNPENTVVKKRSFGNDSAKVAALSQKVLDGLHEGNAYTDKSLEELEQQELVPFQNAIENHIAIIMAGHISVPNVTGDNTPSSLSKIMITDVLREKMGFDGIVITDALNMGAISQHYSSAEVSVRVIEAGGDMLLMPENFQEAYQGILEAVQNGTLTEERIDESVRRILKVKEKLTAED